MHYQFEVKMSCSGCSGAVTRALNKLEGVDKVDANLEKQTVDVYTGSVDYETVLEKIKKTGKEVSGGKVIA
jgi:copper chaperone